MNWLTQLFDPALRFQVKYAEHLANRFRLVQYPNAHVVLENEWIEPRGLNAALARDPHVVITGAAGAGKTTALAHLARAHAHGLRVHSLDRVPLFFSGGELRGQSLPRITDLPRGLNLGDDLAAQCPRVYFPGVLNNHRALVLVDDADAVPQDQLLAWLAEFKDARIVLTATAPIPGYGEFALPGWRDGDLEAYAQKWNAANASGLLAALKANPVPRALTANPMTFGLLARVWRVDQPLPTRRTDLFDAYARAIVSDADDSAKMLEEVALAGQQGKAPSNEFLARAKGFLRAGRNRTAEFTHDLWQAYFAARALRATADLKSLAEHFDDHAWDDVSLFYAGLGDASRLVDALVAHGNLALAGRVLAHAQTVRDDQRELVTQEMKQRAWAGETDAMAALSEMHHDNAVDQFAAKLKDKDAAVRIQAADLLGALQLDRGIEYLLPQLRDISADVRDHVVAALGHARTDRVIEPLLVALRGDARVGVVDTRMRVASAKALGEIASDKALPALFVELQMGEPEIRAVAADALKRIASPLMRAPLVGILQTGDDDARKYAAEIWVVVDGKN